MRLKLSLLLMLAFCLPALAATGIKGTVVDASTGKPVADANILLRAQQLFTTSASDGTFEITNAESGSDQLDIIAYGYDDMSVDVEILADMVRNIGEIKLKAESSATLDADNYVFDEDAVADDSGMQQSVGTIQGATDNIFYQAANYNFSIKRYRFRGYNSNWSEGYINGVNYNDAMRGQFNYSGLGGMTSSAFRSKSSEMGLQPASYGYGGLGGSQNFTTYASEYAPGFRGNLSYTNSNYMLRAMLQYSTGLNKHGWAFSASIIGRYAPEGVIKGTFYNSIGYALSIQKVFNEQHSLNLTTWGSPTERATSNAATQEAYDLAGSNLYNYDWGYLNGKKHSDRVIKSFDPSAMLNWIWRPKMGVTLNTALAFRHNAYQRSKLNFYQAADPKPTYYQNLPSYYLPDADPGTDLYEQQLQKYNEVKYAWENDESVRQIDWDGIYQTNLLNRQWYDRDPELKGQSSYILMDDHSDITSYMLTSNLDMRINDKLKLQGGVNFSYNNAHYYATVNDLLGGEFWRNVDNFSERDFAGDPDKLQNDMRNPNFRAKEGDKIEYDYNIHIYKAGIWLQNEWDTQHWNVNYAVQGNIVNFYRDGNMQNGRAPEHSYGHETDANGNKRSHTFVTGALKAGATWKINGRNYITANATIGNRAPLVNDAYVNARIKDEICSDLKAEEYVSADLSYQWNYSRFRGSITGFWTKMWNGMRHNYFYDYDLKTMMAYAMSNITTEYKGVELGLKYDIWNGLSVSAAGVFSRYQYKNNPTGTRSAQNGAMADVTRTAYMKNVYLGGTPQQAYSLALNYNIKQWFFEVNAQYFCDGYVEAAPTRHEEMPGLWKFATSVEEYRAEQARIGAQEKLKNAFVMNLSVGKVIYTNFGSLNFNLSVNNLLNNRNIQTGGFQEYKFDYTNYTTTKFPNRYWYAQGIRIFFNFGIRF